MDLAIDDSIRCFFIGLPVMVPTRMATLLP
jgi:hypothetical protein